MKILIACEHSGVVRDAFIKRGHDAWSCDILDTASPGPHLKCDVTDILADNWDMMIGHPPCTHLASSGAKHFAQKRADGRQQEALAFVQLLMGAPIKRIAIENPVGIISSEIRRPDQIVDMWWFGEEAQKKTCLWLKGLPKLHATNPIGKTYSCRCGNNFSQYFGELGCPSCKGASGKAVLGYGHRVITSGGRVLPKWYNLPPSPDRGNKRSRTFQGFADAMADQWG